MTRRVFLHMDMDAFFAAIEQRDCPFWRGKPVVVGADPKAGQGRGVVSTCSYEARRFGIRSAMPIRQAYRLCPSAIFLPVDMKKYQQDSRKIFRLLYDFTPDIEPVSVDEAFLDITATAHLFKTPLDTGRAIKNRIQKEIGLTASVGIAPVKMAAKIASDLYKPDGLFEVLPGELEAFLSPLDVRRLWGVGPKCEQRLKALGLETIGQLAACPATVLAREFGAAGRQLARLARGIDDRLVTTDAEVKSVSHEHTFATDTSDERRMQQALLALSEKVSHRLRQGQLKGKVVTLKIRLAGFKTYTRCVTLPQRTNFERAIFEAARSLWQEFYQPEQRIRLLGVRVSQFEDPYVLEGLFVDPSQQKEEKIHQALDSIKERFGEQAIHRIL